MRYGIGAIAAALVLAGSAGASYAAEVTDAAGRDFTIDGSASIVSLGGSVTEILYALGLEQRIVAVDSTSTYPAEALSEHPDVGYLRALSPEGVLSAGGDVVIAEADAGPPEAVALLEEASVPFVRVPGEPSLEGVVEKIRIVSRAAGAEAEGEALAEKVEADFAAVQADVAKVDEPASVIFVLSMADGRVMAAGEDTSAEAMIRLAGARNAFSGFKGYKPVNDEAILEAAPEVIVMMARGDHAAGAEQVFAHPALGATPAAADRRLVTLDGLYLLGFGPRTAEAVRDLAEAIYPEIGGL